MSAKVSPRKKKASRSTNRSSEQSAANVVAADGIEAAADAPVEAAADAPVEAAAERNSQAAQVAEHVQPPMGLPAQVAEPTPVAAAEAEGEAVTLSLDAETAPMPAQTEGAEGAEAPRGDARPVAMDSQPAAAPSPSEATAASTPTAGPAALELPGSEASSTAALTAIRRALPSREQAAAALRRVTLRQSLLSAIDLLLPTQGAVVEVGCGAGLVCAYLAQTAPGRTLLGIDHEPSQLRRAERLARDLGLSQIQYLLGDVQTVEPPTPVAAIYAIDALHRLPAHRHEEVLARMVSWLQPGGTLVIKELTTASPLGTRVAELVDWTLNKTLQGVLGEPATSGQAAEASYRHHEDWLAMLRRLGLRARAGLVPDLLQPHVLLTATRP